MSYIVLARKYRPKKFSAVVGQDHIARTLKNALRLDKLAHAYILSGPRGVGKTTIARILAKTLNCTNSVDNEPCDKCPVCVEVNKGSFLDIIEIDGASNRGIDEIRALRDNVRFTPVAGKYKVYIIDEAHQITTDAYNALLKTIEEPPGHVLFLLATTDPHKIPATIFSRCQRFVFRPLTESEIKGHLITIIEKEGVSVESEVLEMISSAASGSIRDALSILDQLISFSQGSIKMDDVRYLLGFLPDELVVSILNSIAAHKPPEVLKSLDDVFSSGHDLSQLARNLLGCFHGILLVKSGCDTEVSAQLKKDVLVSLKDAFSEEELVRDIELLDRAIVEMRRTGEFRLVLQICLYKISSLYISLENILRKLDRLEKGSSAEAEDGGVDAGGVAEEARPSEGAISPEVKKKDLIDKEIPAASSGAEQVVNDDPSTDIWNRMVSDISKVKPSLASALKECRVAVSGDNVWEVSFPNKFSLGQFERQKELVAGKIKELTGSNALSFKTKVEVFAEKDSEDDEDTDLSGITSSAPTDDDADDAAFGKGRNNRDDEMSAAEQDPHVKKVVEMFDGRIVSVTRRKHK